MPTFLIECENCGARMVECEGYKDTWQCLDCDWVTTVGAFE